MTTLVGYTGFVGNNIYAKGTFNQVYNSQNILDAYSTKPDLLIYAGLRAEKFLANSNPEKDFELITQAKTNIVNINPHNMVLISTIDVFKNPVNVDETSAIDTENLHTYGYNRYLLEEWVRENYPNSLIIRLPGLYGKKIKKNFIYDYMNPVPTMLKKDKMEQLVQKDKRILSYYQDQDNGFYKVQDLERRDKVILNGILEIVGFNSLYFTDSRSSYQFYPLSHLWNDINIALKNKINLLHLATEPITAGELYAFLTGETFINELSGTPANYDYRTIHAPLFGGDNGYILSKQWIVSDICDFIKEEQNQQHLDH